MVLKNIPFEKGSLETMIDRLYQTMDSMDKQWSKKVEPASENQIHTLERISGLEENGKNIPLAYLLYLRAMGKNDNGLLEQEWDGNAEANIDNVLKNYNLYAEDVNKNEYMPLLIHWTDAVLFLRLADGENPSVHYFDFIEDRTLFAGSFEKYLFQMAFRRVEKTQFLYQVHLSASQQELQNILSGGSAQVFQWTKPIEYMERILKHYQLQKAWFSDEIRFYGISPDYIMSVDLHWALNITISSDSHIAIQNMKESLTSLFGDLVRW